MFIGTTEKIPLIRQCELANLARSSFYYQQCRDDSYNEKLMNLLDKGYTDYPFYGIRQLTRWLRSIGYKVNHKRIKRLLRKMGIHAIYPKRNLSLANCGHKIYPYLLRRMKIVRPNQVWATDITYIRMKPGWLYLVAILDWFSRYVIGWKLSNTLDVHFCREALENALLKATPEIFNSDQGAQFTSRDFTGILEKAGIQISMDGRGRAYDNIYVERLWRSVKYEEVYLNDYQTVSEAKRGIETYFRFYNEQRFHSALDGKRPAEIYFSGIENQERKQR